MKNYEKKAKQLSTNIKANSIEVQKLILKTPTGEKIELKIDSVGEKNQILVYNGKGNFFTWEDKEQKTDYNTLSKDEIYDLTQIDSNFINFINIRKGNIFILNKNQQFLLKYNIDFEVTNHLLDYYIIFKFDNKEISKTYVGVSIAPNKLITITGSFILPNFNINNIISVKIITDDIVIDNRISTVTLYKNSYYEVILL
jgi:hypothetical protein